jgi:hypothetical protein
VTGHRSWSEARREDKGMPHRHTRAKIRLLLAGGAVRSAWLTEMVLKLAEKRPDEVLDVVTAVLSAHEELPDAEFRQQAADFISRNEGLMQQLDTGAFPVMEPTE